MKTILLLSIFLSFHLFSCKSPEQKEIKVSASEIYSLVENTNDEIQQENYLVRDSLAMAWEQKLFEFTKSSNFKSEKIAVQNLHDDSIIDTLITYSQNNSKIEVYKARHFEAVKSAYIESPDFLLDEFLHVGSKKLVLENIVAQGLSEEPIKVGNLERTRVFTFTFKDLFIQSITFEGYVD